MCGRFVSTPYALHDIQFLHLDLSDVLIFHELTPVTDLKNGFGKLLQQKKSGLKSVAAP
jgi:hypothetical protein